MFDSLCFIIRTSLNIYLMSYFFLILIISTTFYSKYKQNTNPKSKDPSVFTLLYSPSLVLDLPGITWVLATAHKHTKYTLFVQYILHFYNKLETNTLSINFDLSVYIGYCIILHVVPRSLSFNYELKKQRLSLYIALKLNSKEPTLRENGRTSLLLK